MENSLSSTSRVSYCNVKAADSCEESSWAMYVENSMDDTYQEDSYDSSGYESPFLISDAASSAVKKLDTKENVTTYLDKRCKKLSNKRRKIVDDLEDTASSPDNSPKAFTLQQLERNPKTGKIDDINALGFLGRSNDYTELQKKGLCLVPLSTIANYLG